MTRASAPGGIARAEVLAGLFGLTRSESRLAIMLADGRNLAECAAALGLTLETTRNYSKRVYGKTGTRGQVDLVRTVMGGIAWLA